jgi:hypothetical protein
MQIGQHVIATHTTRFRVKQKEKTYDVLFDNGGFAHVQVMCAASRRGLGGWRHLSRNGPTARAVAFAAASAAADSPPPGGPAANLWAGVAARYA